MALLTAVLRRRWRIAQVSVVAAAAVLALQAVVGMAHPIPQPHAGPTAAPIARAARGAALKAIWGPVTLPDGRSSFATLHRLGVNIFQVDLKWYATAPQRPANPQDPNDPAYQWPAELDQAVRESTRYGIRLMFLVQGTPRWANGNRIAAWAPTNAQDYADFLIAAARRYPSVHLWMMWGEPNRDGSQDFQPMPAHSPVGPRRYALLLDAGYHALKHVSPANSVIGGDTWSFGVVEPADFVRWMRLPNGHPPPLDFFGHNPFGRRFPNLREKPYFRGGRDINDIDTLEAQLRRVYHRTVPLWLSEFTISSDHNNSAFDFHVSRRQQAQWLSAAFRLVNSVSYVKALGWFTLLDGKPVGSDYLTNGLLTYRLKPKPAYYAYKHAR